MAVFKIPTHEKTIYSGIANNLSAILQPKNKMFKIFTLFLPYKNGEYEYFGIIQKCKKPSKTYSF